MRIATEIVLTQEEQLELSGLARSGLTSVRLVQRARIVLLASEGLQNKDIAEELGVDRGQVRRWRERYAQLRLSGMERDLPRGAPPAKVDVARLVALTTDGKPRRQPIGARAQWPPNYAQAPERTGMARQAPHVFHANLGILVEHGGAVLPGYF